MNDWFFMLGEPLSDAERTLAREYLDAFGFRENAVVDVPNWRTAREIITSPECDPALWQAEQAERRRLLDQAQALHGETAVRASLSAAVSASEPAHGDAAIAAARVGCTDVGFIRAAAGAASEAAYLATLAALAAAPASHAFFAKQSLFAAGHWPLGVTEGRFCVF